MNTPDPERWWENEPLLIYETCLYTLAGFSCGSGWQDTADPACEVDVIQRSHAMQTHGVSFIEGHLSNQRCYFKSDQFHENGRDYLADYLKLSRPAGYRTIVYFNTHAIKPAFGNEYPAWKQVRRDGSTIEDLYGVETAFCVNSPWRDWVRAVCLDLCKYPVNGIFFDGPCLYRDACYCRHCRELYRQQHGTEMPPKQPGHAELRQLAFFQAESLRGFFEYCNQAIKATRPDVALYGNLAPKDEPYYAVGRNNRILIQSVDILGAEGGFVSHQLSRMPIWRVGANAKYYQTQSGGKPTVIFNSPAHAPWRSFYQPEVELRLALAQAPLHGSGVWFSGFNWFKDQAAFAKLAGDFKFFREQRDAYFQTVSKARVAIVWPADALNFYGQPQVLHGDFTQGGQAGETVGDLGEEFNGFYDALIGSQVPCDIIDEESIRAGDISRYDLLILPNVACTGQAVDDRLREYVRNGGHLVASFETALCDEHGRRGARLSLEDLFGVRLLRTPLKPYPHFYFFRSTESPDFFKDIHPELLPAPLISTEVTLAGARMVSAYSRKFKGWDGSEIKPSEHPAVALHHFGRGQAVYLAGTYGAHYWNYKQTEIRLLFRNIISRLSQRDILVENLRAAAEVVHRQTRDGAQEMVSLINYAGGLSRPFERIEPQHNIRLKIRTPRQGARALVSNDPVSTRREGEWLVVNIPKVHLFETVVLT
ncbi:MAG: beta-galactosidase trimerization domain-containing protein [Verrucomicrobia bacterium]|nr:beta-galactosidase trimerization domain-containing protein [Verrucomicrobiota bacterium]